MITNQYQLIAQQAYRLPPQEQLRLIQQLAERLAQVPSDTTPRMLVYGEFANTPGREFSTEEDFKLAEWHPTEAERLFSAESFLRDASHCRQ